MKHFRPTSLFLLAALAWPLAGRAADAAPAAPAATADTGAVVLAAPKANEVIDPRDRERLLAVAESDLNRTDPAFEKHLQSFDNPFYLKEAPPPVPVAPSNTTTPAPPSEPVVTKLSDADKLAEVAAALHPSGTMGMGDLLVLVFENRPPLHAGQTLQVTFPDESQPTNIVLLSISAKSFTLKLNDAVLPVPLNRPSTQGGSVKSSNSKP